VKTPKIVDALGALAHEHRLAIYRLLVQRGPEGLPAGTIGMRVGLVPSSLTFHLQNLQRAGLITQRREQRNDVFNELHAIPSCEACKTRGQSRLKRAPMHAQSSGLRNT
jgi:DNA-binding transcriptional ArsR family regulator